MDKEVHTIGPSDGLSFTFEFGSSEKVNGPLLGELTVWVGASLVWGTETNAGQPAKGVEWYWQDLLHHLAEVSHVIALEETYPLGLDLTVPQLLWQAAKERWYGFSDELVDEEEEVLLAFEECHDLARAAEGCDLPSLFLLREGAKMILATRDGVRHRPALEVLTCLTAVGDFLASRAERSASVECQAVAKQWRSRLVIDQDKVRSAELVSSLPRDRLKQIAEGASFDAFWKLGKIVPSENAYLIAARMASGTLSDADMRDLLGKLEVASDPAFGNSSPKGIPLDALSNEASTQLREAQQAYNQGYELGIWLRRRMSLSESAKVDVQQILSRLGVTVWEVELSTEALDALLLWRIGPPPVVILNKIGKRSRFPKGRRASLAHELCHILIDRNGAFPVLEIQGGRLPRWPEQRANAFAAEFLLPRSTIVDSAAKHDVVALLDHLSETYEVSHELAAWQVLNSELRLRRSERTLLKSYTHSGTFA